MKLYYSGNSPYARRVRLAARESGMMDRIEEVNVSPLSQDAGAPLVKLGPGGKVPGLLTDSGTYVCETLLITRLIDDLSGGRLQPESSEEREAALEVEGIASLLMDSLFLRSHEKRRDPAEHSPAVIEKEHLRATRCYDALEARAERFGDQLNLGTIAVIGSLGYADWRHPDDGWREGRPRLAGWFEAMASRPSVAETKPVF